MKFDNLITPPIQGDTAKSGFVPVGSLEIYWASSILIFGFIIMVIILFVAYRHKYAANDTLRLVTVTLIVIATLFLIATGLTSQQIAPAMGLFGTIAGYLLGRAGKKKEDDDG